VRQIRANCLCGGTNYLPSYNVLAEVQGSITLSPQQMPHASTYIRVTTLDFGGEMPRLSDVWRSRRSWYVTDADGVIGVNKVWRKLKASWTMSKRDFVALVLSIWEVRRGSVARIGELGVLLIKEATHCTHLLIEKVDL
jgi:hypothetical protein